MIHRMSYPNDGDGKGYYKHRPRGLSGETWDSLASSMDSCEYGFCCEIVEIVQLTSDECCHANAAAVNLKNVFHCADCTLEAKVKILDVKPDGEDDEPNVEPKLERFSKLVSAFTQSSAEARCKKEGSVSTVLISVPPDGDNLLERLLAKQAAEGTQIFKVIPVTTGAVLPAWPKKNAEVAAVPPEKPA